jgi:hypothetical protein
MCDREYTSYISDRWYNVQLLEEPTNINLEGRRSSRPGWSGRWRTGLMNVFYPVGLGVGVSLLCAIISCNYSHPSTVIEKGYPQQKT